MAHLSALREEREGNSAEEERVQGREIRYGNGLILVHEATGKLLTVTKQRGMEPSTKKLALDIDGNNTSAMIVHPAFKTYSDGSPISSGDLLTFQTKKTISGSHYYLHMGEVKELMANPEPCQRSLTIRHDYIKGGQELNAMSADARYARV